jgi:cyclase
MPLAKRIIPTLLCRGRQLVKGAAFNSWRSVGHAAQAVRIHQARGVDELVLLDIAATAEERGPDLALVEELSEVLFCPLAVGGGVRSLRHVRELLNAGADKVVIGTGALETGVVQEASAIVGCQALVVAIDVRGPQVYARNGKKAFDTAPGSPLLAADWAQEMQAAGAGEILLTNIDHEGGMQGYDLELIRWVSQAVGIPVIAHGGCGSYEHMRLAIGAGASAIAAGALFQFTEATPREAAAYLADHGVEARV